MPSGNIAEVHCSQISAAANELLEVRNQRRVSLVQTSLVSQPLAVIPEVRPLAGDLLAAELHGLKSIQRTSQQQADLTRRQQQQRLQDELAEELRDISARRSVNETSRLFRDTERRLEQPKKSQPEAYKELLVVSSHRRVNQVVDAIHEQHHRMPPKTNVRFTTYRAYNPPPNRSEKMLQTIQMFDKGNKASAADSAPVVVLPIDPAPVITSAERAQAKVHDIIGVFTKSTEGEDQTVPDAPARITLPDVVLPGGNEKNSNSHREVATAASVRVPQPSSLAASVTQRSGLAAQKEELRSSRLSLYVMEEEVLLNRVGQDRDDEERDCLAGVEVLKLIQAMEGHKQSKTRGYGIQGACGPVPPSEAACLEGGKKAIGKENMKTSENELHVFRDEIDINEEVKKRVVDTERVGKAIQNSVIPDQNGKENSNSEAKTDEIIREEVTSNEVIRLVATSGEVISEKVISEKVVSGEVKPECIISTTEAGGKTHGSQILQPEGHKEAPPKKEVKEAADTNNAKVMQEVKETNKGEVSKEEKELVETSKAEVKQDVKEAAEPKKAEVKKEVKEAAETSKAEVRKKLAPEGEVKSTEKLVKWKIEVEGPSGSKYTEEAEEETEEIMEKKEVETKGNKVCMPLYELTFINRLQDCAHNVQ